MIIDFRSITRFAREIIRDSLVGRSLLSSLSLDRASGTPVRVGVARRRIVRSAGAVFGLVAAFVPGVRAATFSGNARVAIADTTGGLSWDNTVGAQALTVSCWFKISVPSGVSLGENMVILANRSTGTWAANRLNETHAYAIYFNAATGNVEFSSRGSTGVLYAKTLIARPFLERWYHVAVVRNGTAIAGFVDGRVAIPSEQITVGDARSTDGVSIGGLGTSSYFRGEILEAQVFSQALSQSQISTNRFRDINPAVWPGLKGYYKLGYTTVAADYFKNYAASPPSGSTPGVSSGTGTIAFEETNRDGEQSVFDSYRNGGRSAVGSLSGAFSWQQDLFNRATPGIPFQLSIGYSSGNAFNQTPLENLDPYYPAPLGVGWRHTFEARVLPKTAFDPASASVPALGVMTWDGSVETWDVVDSANGVTRFKTRHGEYRGELELAGDSLLPSSTVRWITPDRITYVFRSPFAIPEGGEPAVLGRLKEIIDPNGNKVVVNVAEAGATAGLVTSVNDTGGGTWTFTYDAGNFLTSVSGPSANAAAQWTATFTYATLTDGTGRKTLGTKSLTGPAGYATVSSTQWQFLYGATGLMTQVTDPKGQADVRIAYDSYGRKISATDALNRIATFGYNQPGLRQMTTTALFGASPDGSVPSRDRVTVQTFDRKLRPISSKDAMGFVRSSDYDAAGNVSAEVDARGARTTMTYDSRANLLTRTNALGETTRWEYAATLADGRPLNKPSKEIRPATAEAPQGWENRYTYDGAGNLLTHKDGPVGGIDFGTLATHAYDGRGLVTSSKDANGNETRFTYDATTGFPLTRIDAFGTPQAATWSSTRSELGWLLTETTPLNETTTQVYNVNGEVVRTTDAIGRVFTKVYDPNGNLLSETDGKGVATTYDYNAADEKIKKTDRGGNVWDFTYTRFGEPETTTGPPAVSGGALQRDTSSRIYDLNGRLIREVDPLGSVTAQPAGTFVAYDYDANGNQIAVTDKLGRTATKTYDALNRVVAVTDPEGNVQRTTYDRAGRVAVQTGPKGNASMHEYDGRGRLVKWTDPEKFVWRYFYDGVGNITRITDALGGNYDMTYGPRNERLTEKNQDNQTWTYTYDARVRLATQLDPNGTRRNLAYDAAGRLSSVAFNSGRTNLLVYDQNNNVTTLNRVNAGGVPPTNLGLNYDGLDRLVSTQDTFNQSVGYTYDALGRVATKIYPGGKVLTHNYDRLGRATTLSFAYSSSQSYAVSFAYDVVGRITSRTYPNGIRQENSFDRSGRLTNLDYKQGTTSLIALSYAYDRNGNKVGGDEKGTLNWKNNPPTTYLESARYTPAGKLIDRTDTAPVTPKVFAYEYDPSGNMIRAASSTDTFALGYDEDNRTTSIVWAAAGSTTTTIANRYDVLGRRVSRTLTGIETRYVLDLAGDMERILSETDAQGNVKAWYVHLSDLTFRVTDSGSVTCFHADSMGNVIYITNQSGAVIQQYAFSPYGRSLGSASQASDSNPYQFGGSFGVMLELPGVYFMRARYYSADAGSFFATDPIRKIGPAWKPEAYGFAQQNTLSNVDPNGEEPITVGAIIIGVVALWKVEQAIGGYVNSALDAGVAASAAYAGKGSWEEFGESIEESIEEEGLEHINSGIGYVKPALDGDWQKWRSNLLNLIPSVPTFNALRKVVTIGHNLYVGSTDSRVIGSRVIDAHNKGERLNNGRRSSNTTDTQGGKNDPFFFLSKSDQKKILENYRNGVGKNGWTDDLQKRALDEKKKATRPPLPPKPPAPTPAPSKTTTTPRKESK
jgi:RHS repeat-associated protein